MWDVRQYEQFRDERSQPFLDLLARVPDRACASIADLGCGTGELTRLLADRWPAARVTGIDTSPEMLDAAAPRAVPGRVEFVQADAASWTAPPHDLVFSNATLQWIGDHDRLMAHLARLVAPGGSLAVQMPANFEAPSHTILRDLGFVRPVPVRPLAWYVARLWDLGFTVDAWETTYVHVLQGEDPVLEWVKGTALRPVLASLGPTQREPFLGSYAARLREAYPRTPRGTLFPFRRIFFVARRP